MDLLTNQPLVVDNGSNCIRSGIAGEPEPTTMIPSYVCRPKHDRTMIGSLEGNRFAGKLAQEHRGLMSLSYPIKNGVVSNWNDLEFLWQQIYDNPLQEQMPSNQLNSEDHPVLVTEAPLNPMKNRENMAQLLFETFNVPAAYFGIPAVLSLYAAGKTTGLTLDVGDGTAHCVPVYQGFALNSAVMRNDLSGNEVTDFLQLLLRKQGISLMTTAEREIVKQIKELHGSINPNTVRNSVRENDGEEMQYKLPDGQRVKLSPQELQRAPELLFRPHIFGSEEKPVHQLLTDAVAKSDIDLRPALFQSIVLSGGTTQTRGFGDRLLSELKESAPGSTKIKIIAPMNRSATAWIGGSILASLSTFKKMWITAEDWAERPSRVHSC